MQREGCAEDDQTRWMSLRGSESIVSSISKKGNFLMAVVLVVLLVVMEMWRQRRETSLRYWRSVVNAASSSSSTLFLSDWTDNNCSMSSNR